MNATIKWIDAGKELPDADMTVLISVSAGTEPVWMGFWDGEIWREVSGAICTGVTHWANLPEAPQ